MYDVSDLTDHLAWCNVYWYYGYSLPMSMCIQSSKREVVDSNPTVGKMLSFWNSGGGGSRVSQLVSANTN